MKYKNSYLSYFLMYNFYYLSWALFSSLISVYLLNKGYKASEVSLVVSISYLSSMIAQPFIGSLSDKYDIKKVNIVLFVLAALGGIFFVLSKNLLMIVIGYSFVLTLINGTNPVMEKVATASPYQYGKIRIWGTIGYALGSQLAGVIYDIISPEAIFVVFVFTMILCIIGLIGTQPDIKENKIEEKTTRIIDLFKNKKYLYYLVISGLFYGITNIGHTYIPSMLTYDGLDVSAASTILSIAVLCEAPLVLFSNKFMDKIGNKTLLVIAYMIVIVQLFIYGFDLSLPLKVIATLIAKHPAGMLFIMINLKVINTLIDERQQITALAFVQTIRNLTSIIFQNIAGNMLDITSYSNMFMVCLAVMMIGLLLVVFFKIDSGNDKKIFS